LWRVLGFRDLIVLTVLSRWINLMSAADKLDRAPVAPFYLHRAPAADRTLASTEKACVCVELCWSEREQVRFALCLARQMRLPLVIEPCARGTCAGHHTESIDACTLTRRRPPPFLIVPSPLNANPYRALQSMKRKRGINFRLL
jgi:hypothetical protein